jgi:hypothetical protein
LKSASDFRRLALRHGAFADVPFNLLNDAWRSGAAIGGFEFHSVPVPWIVAGGNHDSARGLPGLYRIGKGRRGRVVVCELDGNSSGGQDFGGGLRKTARSKARVIADHQPARRIFIL